METIVDGIHVINMDKDIFRLNEFDTMMKSNNWNYSRFSAINGKNINNKFFNSHDKHLDIINSQEKDLIESDENYNLIQSKKTPENVIQGKVYFKI